MGYAFVDSAGLRHRKSLLESTAVQLAAGRHEAAGILAAAGHTAAAVEPVQRSVAFAEDWAERLAEFIAEAELGATWQRARPWIGRLGMDVDGARAWFYRRAVLTAVEAMRAGQSPEQAGLGRALFPEWYLARQDEVQDLRHRVRALAVEQYMHGGDRSLLRRLAEQLEELRTTPVSLTQIGGYLFDTPVLDARQQRDSIYGEVLADYYLAYVQAGAKVWKQGREISDFLPEKGLSTIANELARFAARPDVAIAFFESLGVDGSAALILHLADFVNFRAEFDDIRVQVPAGLVRAFAEAFARASGNLSFSGGELLAAWHEAWAERTVAWLEPPVTELFRFGQWDPDFLISAYDDAMERFDSWHFPLTDTFGLDRNDWAGDPRSVPLGAIARNPVVDLAGFLTEERIVQLVETRFLDDGAGAGAVLGQLGRLDAASADARAAVARVIAVIAARGGKLQPNTALGAAAMVDRHLATFIPVHAYNPESGAFDLPLDTRLIRFDVERPAYPISELDRVRFLEVVMRSEIAQVVLFDSLGRTLRRLMSRHASDPSDVAAISDELGLLVGRFVDAAGAVAVEAGKDGDAANALAQRLWGAVVGFAVSASAGALLPATSAGAIVAHLISAAQGQVSITVLEEIFPTDNELGEWVDRYHAVVDPDAERQFRMLVLAELYESDPSLFDQARIPAGVVANGSLVLPGKREGATPELWRDWWEQNPFTSTDTYQLVALATSDFFARRAMAGSAEYGPDFPLSQP